VALDTCPHFQLKLGLLEFPFVAPSDADLQEERLAHPTQYAKPGESESVEAKEIRLIAHDGLLTDFLYYGQVHFFE